MFIILQPGKFGSSYERAFDFCKNQHIRSHGGFGLTYSLGSYDVTDFRLCKNHISYGNYLKDLIDSNDCILKLLNLNENQKI